MVLTTEYKPEYRDQVLELVQQFEAESFGEFGLGINPELFDQMIDSQKDSSFLLLIDGKLEGLLAGYSTKAPCIKDGLVWQETVWFVSKKYRNSRYGLQLFKMASEALKQRGITAMLMAHLHNETGEKLGKLYDRLGFKPLETHYIRRLQ